MEQKPKFSIEDVAAHQHLTLVYTTELPPHVTAMLDDRPNPTYVAVNATQPPFEQHSSVLYAIGRHYLPRHPAKRTPWYHSLLNRNWRNRHMRLWMRATRRSFNRTFSHDKQSERFALVMMIKLGYQEDLRLYLEKHPQMTGWAVWLSVLMTAQALKQRFVRFLKHLFTSNLALP